MSDNEDLEISVEPEAPKAKPKKVMSESQLEKLKLAREKAAQVKRAAKAEKDKLQKEMIEKEKAKRIAKMEDKVKKQYIDLDDKPKEAPKKEPLEEQVEVMTKPKKPKKKVVVMHNSDSDSDSDTQVIYIPKKRSNKPKDAPPLEQAHPPPVQRQAAFGYVPNIPRYAMPFGSRPF